MLKNIVYLKEEDYIKLKTDGTVEVNGQTIIYSDNDIYMTPDDTDEKMAAMESKIYELGLDIGPKVYYHNVYVTLIGEEVTYPEFPDEPPYQSIHGYEFSFYSFYKTTGFTITISHEYSDIVLAEISATDAISAPVVWYGGEMGTTFDGSMNATSGFNIYPGVAYVYNFLQDFVVSEGTKIIDYEISTVVTEVKSTNTTSQAVATALNEVIALQNELIDGGNE